MDLDLSRLSAQERDTLLNDVVTPRPIAWVSSLDRAGAVTVAPFSRFTAICSTPMTLMFCIANADAGVGETTVRNISARGEFVINFADVTTAAALQRSATPPPSDQSIWAWLGVTAAPSQTVHTPRVAEAPAAFECRLQQLMQMGFGPTGTAVIFAEVKSIYVRDELYRDGRLPLDLYQPLGCLGDQRYIKVAESGLA